MAISGRNKHGTTTIRANIATKIVLPSPFLMGCKVLGRVSPSRPLRRKISRILLVNEAFRQLRALEGVVVSGLTGGR